LKKRGYVDLSRYGVLRFPPNTTNTYVLYHSS